MSDAGQSTSPGTSAVDAEPVGSRSAMAGLPPLAVGFAAAVSGELTAGLMLYYGQGFRQAITVVLGTLAVAMAVGLWAGSGEGGDERRAWLGLLVALLLAVLWSGGWTFIPDFRTGWLRGVGLGVMGGLPLYMAGLVLSRMSRSDRRSAAVAVPASIGVAAGILVEGVILFSRLAPPTTFAIALVAASGGAWIADLHSPDPAPAKS